jgi:pimeloyl-ACP methyl ester carboxylesterase
MELDVERAAGRQRAYAYTGGKAFDPQQPAVVFIHGALHDHSVWTLLARWFANHGHAVLALDLPGHGRSAGPALDSVEALAGWLLGLLDAAGLGTAALVGHSMGSLIALEAAAQAPQRVTRLALLGTALPMTVSPALLATARDAPLQAIDMVNAFSHSTQAAKPAYPGPGSWLHGANRALMRRVQAGSPDPNLFLVDFEVCNRYAAGLDAARKVECPATCVLGARDQMTPPKQAAELATALRADVITVEAGHAMTAEAPDAVLAALRRALA